MPIAVSDKMKTKKNL